MQIEEKRNIVFPHLEVLLKTIDAIYPIIFVVLVKDWNKSIEVDVNGTILYLAPVFRFHDLTLTPRKIYFTSQTIHYG
ncbi:hypothetical protein CM19_04115 [Candidatus Acidianus copahuensis]|uniref:Uncharacterized protein n=1 Tax=Candidatus Acidianus copahuensis TaxID=1160895 RepID=A0A031LRQ4_9CREN|nr:hypothetical protein [Candidatus Acidianus copahuensis]EZQ10501.1 hypothetical protein CM19_04115 [Candidatus Acidianus copahuensis]